MGGTSPPDPTISRLCGSDSEVVKTEGMGKRCIKRQLKRRDSGFVLTSHADIQ